MQMPTGTITFLFTDIEESTRRWQRFPDIMKRTIARHDQLLHAVMHLHGGVVFKTVGDAFCVAFSTAGHAVQAAIDAQNALAAEPWALEITPLRVRIAVHTGEAEQREADYFGQTLNHVARLLSAAHGGQVLLTGSTHALIEANIPVVDLGVHFLKDIQQPEHIFQLVYSHQSIQFPPIKTLGHRRQNLPLQLTAFIGREQELTAISQLLGDQQIRLVTLIGPGGTGKTRLSIQVGSLLAESFPDGVYFVELATVRDISSVIPTIAQAIGVSKHWNLSLLDLLKEHLDAAILLILDNFEQVVQAGAFITELLLACPQLKVLISSREALHIDGEHEYHVSPLRVPFYDTSQSPQELLRWDAIALFLQQARAIKPDFELTAQNAAAIVEICCRLDGLPLAIELAAARINILPPQAMLKRISHSLKLLTGGERNRSERQRTLRNAIAWSYDLLDQNEKQLFAQLSIFAGGCTLEAIEQICQSTVSKEVDIFNVLHSLLTKSLIQQHEQIDEEPRFEMLTTIREFAQETLASEHYPPLREMHATYYLELAEQAEPGLIGAEQKYWMQILKTEQENLQLAFSWSVQHLQVEAGLRMVSALWRFWLIVGQTEDTKQTLEELLKLDIQQPPSMRVKARALHGMGILAIHQGHLQQATHLAEEALALSLHLQDKELISRAYVTMADAALHQGAIQQATSLLEKSLHIKQETGDQRGMATLLNNLGNVAIKQGKLVDAAKLHAESLALFEKVGDEYAIASAFNNLGDVEKQLHHYEQAALLYQEGLKHSQALDYTIGIAISQANLAEIALYQHVYDQAATLYKQSLALFQKQDDRFGIATCLAGLAQVAFTDNQFSLAAHLFARAQKMYNQFNKMVQQEDPVFNGQAIQTLEDQLGEVSFTAYWQAGLTDKLQQVIADALSITIQSKMP
ncbi:ATP-binding protein [Tengunoibacter tsumagoiensis]|uniref:LuxR family transcriptional regulator n=1 Tax=Tengunoibacter tsumagoiensis TaxID=2014871 RepID=A0A402A687_9CHLR|nr:tetratricopeptide repeat protein [Tengunoibacter tsumagoiensis]GCE14642.1 LuxR family transcriptional regulator [Tengunoibacter tsumagoiensis]